MSVPWTVHWSPGRPGSGLARISNVNPGSLSMTANKSVTAVFEQIPPTQFTLTTKVTGQGAADRLERLAAHDDGVAHRLGLEVLEVLGDVPGQTAPRSDDAAGTDRADEGERLAGGRGGLGRRRDHGRGL